MSLAARASKGLELSADTRVLGQNDIGSELEDTGRGRAEGLGVELDVPDTGSAVLWVTGTAGVNEALLARGVGADKGGEAVGLDGLVLEQLNQEVGGAGDGREKVVGAWLGGVLAADVCADTGSERADDGGDVGGELNKIGHTDAELLVLVVPDLSLGNDLLKTVVLATAHLLGSQNDGSICAAKVTSGFGPAAGIVEAETHGGTGKVGATAGLALEHTLKIVGDVLPDTACVGSAGWRALGGEVVGLAGGDIYISALGVDIVAKKDRLDGLAHGGELGVVEGGEVTNQLGRVEVVIVGTAAVRINTGADFGEGVLHAWVGRDGGGREGCGKESNTHIDYG